MNYLSIGKVKYKNVLYYSLLMILELLLYGIFLSYNLLCFYILFEISIIPMFFIILLWGTRQRKIHAVFYFFFYTIFGSILLLFGLLYLYVQVKTLNVFHLRNTVLGLGLEKIIFIFFFFGFAVKIPLVPFHM